MDSPSNNLETVDHEIARRLLTFGFPLLLVSELTHLSYSEIGGLTGWELRADDDEVNALLVGLMKKILIEAHLTLEFGMSDEKQYLMRMILPSMVRVADADAQQGRALQDAVERIWEKQRELVIDTTGT